MTTERPEKAESRAAENLLQAWEQVRANKGAAGVDGMKVREFLELVNIVLDELNHELEKRGPRARRRKLLKLGIKRDEVHKASRARKGHWRMSQMSLVRWAMNNDYFQKEKKTRLLGVAQQSGHDRNS